MKTSAGNRKASPISSGEVIGEAYGACEARLLSSPYLASLAALRTFAQRSRCASAMRSRASLLKVRPVFLSFFPPARPRALSAFPTLPISDSRREYSFCKEATTLFSVVIHTPWQERLTRARGKLEKKYLILDQ